MNDSYEFLMERYQSQIYEKSDIEYEKRLKIEESITFDDLLEELANSSKEDGKDLMKYMLLPNVGSLSSIYVILDCAKERIISRKMSEVYAK